MQDLELKLKELKLSQENTNVILEMAKARERNLVAEIIHTVNNKMAGALGFTELLYGDLKHFKSENPLLNVDSLVQDAEDAKTALDHMSEFTKDLSLSTGIASSSSSPTSLSYIVGEYFDSDDFRNDFPNFSPQDGFSVDQEVWVRADPKVAVSSVRNLVRLTGQLSKGHVVFGLESQESAKIYAQISKVNPVLLDAENLSYFFTPFYLKRLLNTRASGLEASVFKGSADAMGGSAMVEPLDEGLLITATYPLCGSYSGKAGEASRGHYLLLVDDDPSVLDMSSKMLRSLGFKVDTAISGEGALALYNSMNNRPALLVLDYTLEGGMSGLDLHREIIRNNPAQKSIIVSGYSDRRGEVLGEPGIKSFLAKPYTREQLFSAVVSGIND